MSVRLIIGDDRVALYCSTTEVAFGPVFMDKDGKFAEERAEEFLKWLPQDARKYTEVTLQQKYNEWCRHETEAQHGIVEG